MNTPTLAAADSISRQKSERATAIAAVVPTLNRPGLLRGALRSLQHQTLPPDVIIVADDGSNPAVDQAGLNAESGSGLMQAILEAAHSVFKNTMMPSTTWPKVSQLRFWACQARKGQAVLTAQTC